LRRRLDDIDDRLQDLLSQRFDVVLQIAAEKRSGSLAPHQPAREAEILRRLVARNRPPLPVGTLVRIWRELLAGTTRLQGGFAVAVYTPPETPGYWDLARDHYGSHTPMLAFQSPHTVIRAVSEGQAAIGVLPVPEDEDPDPWWRHLVSPDEQVPRVIARLPFGPRGNARSDGEALAIGFVAPERSGEDRTLFAVEAAADTGRARILAALSQARLACTLLAVCERDGRTLALIEVDGFVPAQDPRLDALAALFGRSLHRVVPLGGYALPLPAETGGPLPDAAKG
jgi:chorismate mutase